MKLLIATRNAHKLEEILAIFSVSGLELLDLRDVPGVRDVVEDGGTFDANARLKAGVTAKAAGMWTLADDSGLEVDALNGAPGVISARYAGEPSNDARNNARLLAELGDSKNRRARFRCVVALSDRHGVCEAVEGRCAGQVAGSERGARGFGYDPLFIPDGHTQTFGEMDPRTKNGISHRFFALQRARAAWESVFRGERDAWDDA